MKQKGKSLWEEFKAFINKGNALMLAVGVVIGGAFSAIVASVVGVFTSLISWLIPGNIGNLIFVLPAIYPAQAGLKVGEETLANSIKAVDVPGIIAQYGLTQEQFEGSYTLIGNKWVANGAAYINVGAIINAAISFILIALILFLVVKIIAVITEKKAKIEADLQEKYYQKHPEERPAPVEEGTPEPTEKELLAQIRDLLKEQKKTKKE